MDWSNRFTFGGFIVSYSTFEMGWEVIEKAEDDDGEEGVDNAHEQQYRAEEVDSDVRRRGGWRQVGQR